LDNKIKLAIKTLEDIKKVCKKSSGKLAESVFNKSENLIKELSSENKNNKISIKDEILNKAGLKESNCAKKDYSMSEKKGYEICTTCGDRIKKSKMKSHMKSCNG
jgi:capsule polysaccharide export protein KpsE/RkpR